MKKPMEIKALIVLELFIAILGLASGISLLSDPSGRGMGLDVVLDKIPLTDFTLLGVWFVLPYGLLPLTLAYGIWAAKGWARTTALILAIIELIWVTGQIYYVGTNILQGVIGIVAILTMSLLYRPSVKEHFNL